MVALNISVDDSSPLISYSGSWTDTPANDTLAANYSAASFHTSDLQGSTASFSFNGTGIWLYGAHRPGYGDYVLSVDGVLVANGSASASNPVFDQFLGGRSNLSLGEHTAVLSSTGGGSIDLDSLIFEIQMGNDSQQIHSAVTDDGDQSISYYPSSPAWGVANQDYFAGGTVHFTETNGSQASMAFSGNAIAIYGGASFDHGNYTVNIDGDSREFDGGTARLYHPQTLLYFADGLNSGQHNLTITTHGKFFDLDSITTYSAADGSTNSTSSPGTGTGSIATGGMQVPTQDGPFHVDQASQSGANASSKSISKPVLIAIIVASAIGLITLILLVLFIVTQIRKRRRRQAEAAQRLASPVLPIQNPDLEAGGGAGFSEKAEVDLERNISKSTAKSGKSAGSRWSQESFFSGPPQLQLMSEAPPPVPPMPLVVPDPFQATSSTPQRGERDSPASEYDNASLSALRDNDGQGSVVDDYYYRNSAASSVAPLRPSRPPSLNLQDLGPEFDHIPLSK